jgi:uncharacterized membrane protein YkvA (DUF1232 family)
VSTRAERSPISLGLSRERPRRGARRTVMGTIRQLPHYLRLLYGLLTDSRVSKLDKLLVVGAIVYVVTPLDFIPDVIPFFGEVDDVFLLMTALQRLIANAGREVVLDHWTGDPVDLADLNVRRAIGAAAFFLPLGMRRKLKKLALRGRR